MQRQAVVKEAENLAAEMQAALERTGNADIVIERLRNGFGRRIPNRPTSSRSKGRPQQQCELLQQSWCPRRRSSVQIPLMDRQAAWAEINATLRAKGFEERQGSIPNYHGKLNIHGAAVDVSLTIPDLTFMELPVIRPLDRSQLAPSVLSHVFHNLDVDSGICYVSGVGLPLDLYSPGGLILRVLEQAKKALEVNYAGRGVAEVTAEYQDYWRDNREPFRILINKEESGNHAAKLGYHHFTPEVGRPFLALCEDAELYAHKSEQYRTALLMQTDQQIGPVGECKVPVDLSELESWFKEQSAFSDSEWTIAEAALFDQGFVAFSASNCTLA